MRAILLSGKTKRNLKNNKFVAKLNIVESESLVEVKCLYEMEYGMLVQLKVISGAKPPTYPGKEIKLVEESGEIHDIVFF